jgi:hypothetical protein
VRRHGYHSSPLNLGCEYRYNFLQVPPLRYGMTRKEVVGPVGRCH